MMVCVLFPLILSVLLCESSSSGAESTPPCPARWLLFGQRCFAFFPVWSSWSTADSLCSQTGGYLASLHTPEEQRFVLRLASTDTPVWLGGYQTQQNGSWFWSDGSPYRISGWTNQGQELNRGGGACMHIDPKSGELRSAPCGELRFYVCSAKASFEASLKPAELGIVPNVSLFDVLWGRSDSLAEEILHSSSFLKQIRSGHLTQRCYASFMQQEALYLQRVSGTLEALLSSLQEADDMRSLLLDSLKHYGSRNQSLPALPPPQWLRLSLESFHSVVLEEPVYWLVALSARACLRDFLSRQLLSSEHLTEPEGDASSLRREWREESLKEVDWTRRYKKVIEEHQHQMDAFKAINIFREHMMNQKSFYKAVACDDA